MDALRKGILLGAGILVLVLPPMWLAQRPKPAEPPVAVLQQPAPQAPAPRVQAPQAGPAAEAVPAAPAESRASRLADFGKAAVSPDVKLVANWSAQTRDHKQHAFVVIDKKNAHMYVFDPQAKLKGSAPVLLGKARGDDSAPGIGTRPLNLVKESEKTTPAGRFVAEPGKNTHGEEIIWVDYDAAVSMHRVRKVAERERRFQRLASPTASDNRISFGCINVPVAFYEGVLDPAVRRTGAIVYVLPDEKPIRQAIGAYDVTAPLVAGQVVHRP